jgi:hypothetical protein
MHIYTTYINWEEVYTELCTGEARRVIVWWKTGVWRLQGVMRNNVQGICPICSREENSSRILRREGTKIWRDEILDKRNIDADMSTRKIVGCKDKE